jgi:uncharacterized protein involved in type VI secretion and phage assembly
MEQEGIYYYFKHDASKHRLVRADDYGAHSAATGYEEVPCFPPTGSNLRQRDHLSAWSASEQIQPGAYMLNDFDFTKPKASLQAKTADPRNHAHAEMEIYDYPGEYVEASNGEQYAKARLQGAPAPRSRSILGPQSWWSITRGARRGRTLSGSRGTCLATPIWTACRVLRCACRQAQSSK